MNSVVVVVICIWGLTGVAAYDGLCWKFRTKPNHLERLGAFACGFLMLPAAFIVIRAGKKWGVE